MPIAVTLALLVFWLVLAYRQFQRGDMVMAGIFLFVGIALTIYRIRQAQSRSPNPPDPPSQDPIGK